ncbi:cytochrome P450 [Thermocatellispora tengchongensis]|uniref:Cytochrome P450 n=1 Tax=Thermocatellispora tengchongensis TaxID=1073253 RepID=A0A840P454_9ACTN|nr:cytochrome P450 [Thermocatellispora tengchongensis]MBB5132260.1 cytochrome P450 [Thermocatellispora tengchongensis]
MTETERGCPYSHVDFGLDTEIYGHYALLDGHREESRFHFNDTTRRGFYMLQRYDDVLEGFQRHETWTTHVRSALNPEPGTALLPQDLNGEAHAKLRRVLNPFFAPAAVKRMTPMAHERCVELIEELRPKGSCDFVAEFAIRYPTDLFLALLGLPVSDGEFFLPWSETLFAGFFGGDPAAAAAAKANIIAYFTEAVRERRANLRDPREDMVSRLVEARIDGEPISEQDILTICMTLMLAGLDTTRSALGYIYTHLARHEEDRRAIVADPGLIPAAVEEFVRLYPLVIQAGREVQEDGEFHGLDLRRGDVMWLGIGSANRDPRKFPEPDRFVLGRKGVNQHLAFGAGPHRCLGMHLARLELAVVLKEWHERIPDYRIKEGTTLVERGGQLTLKTLPLEWEV